MTGYGARMRTLQPPPSSRAPMACTTGWIQGSSLPSWVPGMIASPMPLTPSGMALVAGAVGGGGRGNQAPAPPPSSRCSGPKVGDVHGGGMGGCGCGWAEWAAPAGGGSGEVEGGDESSGAVEEEVEEEGEGEEDFVECEAMKGNGARMRTSWPPLSSGAPMACTAGWIQGSSPPSWAPGRIALPMPSMP